mgnify:CR=1 FL=1
MENNLKKYIFWKKTKTTIISFFIFNFFYFSILFYGKCGRDNITNMHNNSIIKIAIPATDDIYPAQTGIAINNAKNKPATTYGS